MTASNTWAAVPLDRKLLIATALRTIVKITSGELLPVLCRPIVAPSMTEPPVETFNPNCPRIRLLGKAITDKEVDWEKLDGMLLPISIICGMAVTPEKGPRTTRDLPDLHCSGQLN
ncbi:hypothetical protein D3C75_812190 [compost metagenome]